ncbi:unnamed protein product [Nyctereutes procyonoides]|uniref:(raccoon dog) hypothetical protein n=1 Tax=Nyctereutes procyonoides TaxID=34880 RepID=A0A811Y9S0_NYCPR|nr:unnamed protein product [Nyctereutes procyonoides]
MALGGQYLASRRVLGALPIPTLALLDKANIHKGHKRESRSSWVEDFPHEFNMTEETSSREKERETKLPFASFSKGHSYTYGMMLMGGGHIQPLEPGSTFWIGTWVMCSSPTRFDTLPTEASVTSTKEPDTLEKGTRSRIINLCRRRCKVYPSSLV